MWSKLPIYVCIIFSFIGQLAWAENDTGYKVHKIDEYVYTLTKHSGSNSEFNIGLVIGEDSLLLVGTFMSSDVHNLEATIASISIKPLKYVVNLAEDAWQHSGNRYFSSKGVKIISHENLRYINPTTNITFSENFSMRFGKNRISAYHIPTHNHDQIALHIEDSDVIFLGHGINTTGFTFLKNGKGIAGFKEAINIMYSIASENTKIIGGNAWKKGLYGSRDDLHTVVEVMEKFRDRVVFLHNRGETAEVISEDKEIHDLALILAPKTNSERIFYHVREIIEIEFPNPFPMTVGQMSKYIGKYRLDGAGEIEVYLESGKLFARQLGAFIFELTPKSETKFDFHAWTENDHLIFNLSPIGAVKSLSPVLVKDGWYSYRIKQGVWTKKDSELN